MDQIVFQNTLVIALGIIGFSVFGFGMFVWIAEKPKRLYDWYLEFPKQQNYTGVKQ